MRILWDFRLFSTGYAARGVGTYTRHVAEEIIRSHPSHTFIIWADKASVPAFMHSWPVKWIPYTKGGWKKDLITIPALIIQHSIDLYHYWVALGPVHSLGTGIIHPCPAIATVYDCAVEFWHDVPFAASKRRTWFWRTQKILIRQCKAVLCISEAARSDITRLLPYYRGALRVVYMPTTRLCSAEESSRKPYFIVLGGSPHKNVRRVVEAFARFHTDNPSYSLHILGEIDATFELPEVLPGAIRFETMENYRRHLNEATGLIFCSQHEGLGIPAIEAMHCGCPMLLSDIPSLKEICGDFARFVNPHKIEEITGGMKDICENLQVWAERSRSASVRYDKLSAEVDKKVLELYSQVSRKPPVVAAEA